MSNFLKPNHTFVICAYKESEYLEECILSCIQQSSVNAGKSLVILYTSTPNEYIEKLTNKYHLQLCVGEGGSIGADWNGALSFVETRYATIAHQDDVYLEDYGTKILAKFSQDNNLNIVFSDYGETDFKGNIRERNINLKIKTFGLKLMNLFSTKMIQRRIYAFGNFICCPAVSYDLQRLASFRFDEQMKMALDWDAWERIMKMEGKIAYVPEILMYHRIHSDSETTVNTTNHQREKEEFLMFQRYWPKGISELLMKFYSKNQNTNQ